MEKYYNEQDNTKSWYLIPIMFILCVVPLIVHLKVIPLQENIQRFWNGQSENFDFFTYYKLVFLVLSALALVFIFIYRILKHGKSFILNTKYHIFLGIYTFFIILSTVTSEYRVLSLYGYADRYEGMIAWITYIVICFLTISFIKTEKHIKLILSSLFVGSFIISLIGIFQFLGFDLWKSEIGKSLMLPSAYENIKDKLNFTLQDKLIYGTLSHYDYIGSYISLILPIAVTLLILVKNNKARILLAIFTASISIVWISCNARSGYIGVFFGLIVLSSLLFKKFKINKKIIGIGFICLILLFIGLNYISNNKISNRVNSLITDITTEKATIDLSENFPLKEAKIENNLAKFKINDSIIFVGIENNTIKFYDENKNILPYTYNTQTGAIQINQELYKDYMLSFISKNNKHMIIIKKQDIIVVLGLKNSKLYLSDINGNELSTTEVEKFGFSGNERLGSSRAYIWSRTIPLLKNSIFKGYGLDTFAAYFPQHDLAGKYYAYYGQMWQLVDKPHNMYLQIAMNTGVVSLVAILIMILLYIFDSLKLYFRCNYDNFTAISGLAIFVGILGYLASVLFNDSVVSVAPIFWILLGMAIAINHKIKKLHKLES